jgi:O-acetylhomoserine/O-acetylserine sulfhydrylase-like pyridoxal-dependent enzyme
MRTFFTENPSLNTFAEAIERTLENKAQVKRLLFAFLSNRKNTLWSVKYSPKGLNGIYSWATVKEVKTWLEKFSQTVREA